MGTLGGRPLKYLEGRGSQCFLGLTFPLSIFQGTKSEKLTKPSEVVQMLALKVFVLNTNKTNTNLNEKFISKNT